MMSRGMAAPTVECRKPLSMMCEISVLISITWPRLALAGTLMSARAMSVLQAGAERDDHVGAVGPERAVRKLGNRSDRLRIGEPHAGREGGPSGAWAEMHADHVGLRVPLGEDVDRLHVVLRRHRAVDFDRARHRVAVLAQRRH